MTDHVNMMHRCRMEVWKRPGCTTWELAEVSGIDYWVLERRLPALRNSGKVRNGDNRVCRIKGRSCLTWFPAGDGADEYLREAAPTLAPLPSEQPPIDPALMSAPDPNIERELELGLFPKWITRAAIDDTKRVWSPSYKYALSDSEAIEILRNVKAFADVLIKARRNRSAAANAMDPETTPGDVGNDTAKSKVIPDQPGPHPERHKAPTSRGHRSTDHTGTAHNGGTPSWSAAMNATTPEFEADCRAHLDRFFAAHPDATMEKRAHKALRLLRASEKPIKGKAVGWAAGIIYAVGTYDRPSVGVPGVLNNEFEKLMGVSMGTTRNRAAAVREFLML